ncbi:hypothetical protein ES705_43886 [subsurface metagenome]
MKEFAQKVTTGLHKADWATRRKIIIAMIKEIKIDEENIQIVYKVSPNTPSTGTEKKNMQHCLRRDGPHLGEKTVSFIIAQWKDLSKYLQG